ncbi:uncharacterized protein LOC133527845 [Cydia pomonella]|uniref:uncharacterized protein LOC133527845 n=1 Tax=Cydia pomonella TaxID=82600 RepID=UPI002ADD614A|nr:uncharacterized protein LOC133527845 [Cydia pomonella]
MADNVVFPRKLLTRFIALYKDQPCLWDKTCQAYKLKRKRNEAITKLTELVQEYDPAATKVHILRKIESLRACVRREYKKVQDSRAKATSSDQIYVPHLWYYDMFTFVFGEDGSNYKTKPGSPAASTGQNEESDEDQPEEESYEQTGNYAAEYNVETSMIEDSRQYYEDTKKRTEVDDEYDAIGINVAAKLRTLPPNMRILAEKLINDVLFQAQMHGLSSSTVISTPDPFK